MEVSLACRAIAEITQERRLVAMHLRRPSHSLCVWEMDVDGNRDTENIQLLGNWLPDFVPFLVEQEVPRSNPNAIFPPSSW